MEYQNPQVSFSETELIGFLEQLAYLLPDGFHADVYVTGGGALMTFYGFTGETTDYDVFLDTAIFPPEMVDAIRMVAQKNGLSDHWINHDVANFPNPYVDTFYEMKDHIVVDNPWILYNANGHNTLTIYATSIACICRNKFSPGCFRDKDIRHFQFIAHQLNIRTPDDMRELILSEYPYIEDEIWWDQELDNIQAFYDIFYQD